MIRANAEIVQRNRQHGPPFPGQFVALEKKLISRGKDILAGFLA